MAKNQISDFKALTDLSKDRKGFLESECNHILTQDQIDKMVKTFRLKHFHTGLTRAETGRLQKRSAAFRRLRTNKKTQKKYDSFWKSLKQRNACLAKAKNKRTFKRMKREQERLEKRLGLHLSQIGTSKEMDWKTLNTLVAKTVKGRFGYDLPTKQV